MPTDNADYIAVNLKRPHERKRATGYIEVYANNAQITGNYFDFEVAFGQITEATVEKLVTEDYVTIKMSPQLAKRLNELLQMHIDKYESTFGAIPEANRITDTQDTQLAQS